MAALQRNVVSVVHRPWKPGHAHKGARLDRESPSDRETMVRPVNRAVIRRLAHTGAGDFSLISGRLLPSAAGVVTASARPFSCGPNGRLSGWEALRGYVTRVNPFADSPIAVTEVPAAGGDEREGENQKGQQALHTRDLLTAAAVK